MFTFTDTQPPNITCPADDIYVEINEECDIYVKLNEECCRANVTYSVSATDNCDPAPEVTCNPPSGSAFNSTSVVNCTATDQSGNSAGCTFLVNVSGTA